MSYTPTGPEADDIIRRARARGAFDPPPEPPPDGPPPHDTEPPTKFTPALFGGMLKDRGDLRLGEDGQLWRHSNGVYRPDGDAWLRAEIRRLLGADYSRSKRLEVEDWCKAELPTIHVTADLDTINVVNGLLDWRTGDLRDHTPDYLSIVQLPVVYDPGATCPTVERYLKEVLPDDAGGLVLEMIGWLLIPDGRFRKAVLLLGPTGAGKSTLLGLIRRLLGPENVATVPLQELSEDRFATSDLYGKLANLCGDLEARAVRRSGLFKQIVGGVDQIRAQRKHGHAFKFVPHARLVFSANEAPGTADQTDAFFTRWIVVPFSQHFSDQDADLGLLDKLTTSSELSGLLNLALEGLRRLETRGHFVQPASVQAAGRAYRESADTVAGFISESCVLEPTAWSVRSELYRAYRDWCEGSGRYPVSAMKFNDHLRGRGGVDEMTLHGERRWVGIGRRHEDSAP